MSSDKYKKKEDEASEEPVEKRSVNLLWIGIFAVVLILSLVTQRRKEVRKMISDRGFFISLSVVVGFIGVLFLVRDPLYTKAVYLGAVALIIALFTQLNMIWSCFYLILALTMSFPALLPT